MNKILLISFMTIYLLFLLACSSTSNQKADTSPEKPTQVTAILMPAEELTWSKVWDRTKEAAKKEGSVVIYTTLASDTTRSLTQSFQKTIGIPVEIVSGRGAEIATKLIRENKSGLNLADIYLGGATTVITQLKPADLLAPLEPELILPEVKDGKMWWGGDLLWVDKEHKHLAFIAYAIPAITINDTVVKAEDIKSYKDLLNPKWKGKLSINDPTTAGIGGKWFSIVGRYIMDLDFMRAIARQDPVILRDQRLQVEWLSQGKYPIAIAATTAVVTEFKKASAPISYVDPVEGTWLGNGDGGLGLMVNAPHHNAARAFINWMLTREGQSLFSQAYGTPSGRVDVSTDGIDPVTIPKPGLKYVIGFKEDVLIGETEFRDTFGKEIFGQLAGR